MRWIKLTHVGFRAHIKIASCIVSYCLNHPTFTLVERTPCLTWVELQQRDLDQCGNGSVHTTADEEGRNKVARL